MNQQKKTLIKSEKAKKIIIRGARVHNLKNIDLELPRNKFVVVTGVSGSGKSSLAFDTIYAEGQRRYVESLSAYARQFLERMDKPDVDFIEGISPAIAIEQKTTGRNPRSTVATATEIYDYLRLLFGRIGKTFCPQCGDEVFRDTISSIVDVILKEQNCERLYVMFPLPDHPGHSMQEELEAVQKRGFIRVFHKGEIQNLSGQPIKSLRSVKKKNEYSVVIDRLVLEKDDKENAQRLADSLETAFRESDGYAQVFLLDQERLLRFTRHFECRNDGNKFEDPDPKLFSFNSPLGACPKCQGFGRAIGIDMSLVVPDPSKTLEEGAIQPWTTPRWRGYFNELLRLAQQFNISTDVPYKNLTVEQQDIIFRGRKGLRGIQHFFRYLEKKKYKIQYRVLLSRYRGYTTCEQCNGSRLRKEALNIRVGGKTINDVVQMSILQAKHFFHSLTLSAFEWNIAKRIVEELRKRLEFLDGVGIGYLTLDRLMLTLSGGESQRINLSTALGSSLVGSLYVLDEPSIGLHPKDNNKLITMLKKLRDIGNTVIVVEHDEDMINAADIIVDLGPKAGENGGEIVFNGTRKELLEKANSLTAQYLRKELSIPVPRKRRKGNGKSVYIYGASEHNLKDIDVKIPLGKFVCITGVSGSGKSTLVYEILASGIQKLKGEFKGTVGRHRAIDGIEAIERVELVDQSPIGRSPRSNPLTYLKIFDLVRHLFASTQAAKIRGFTPTHFSFNVPGGRCEVCEGNGVQKIEMQFLADLYLQCEECNGKRFKQEVLEIRWQGKNVDDILSMTVTEAMDFFDKSAEGRKIARRLKVLNDVGLGYIRLGQPATTLSGGEAQRVKLASHLSSAEGEGNILFLFDEPTTGLHFDDIAKLLKSFDVLIKEGNSIIVVEHNLHVIKCADHIIDLGPEAGEEGGRIVVEGTPEIVAEFNGSHTGVFLKKYLA